MTRRAKQGNWWSLGGRSLPAACIGCGLCCCIDQQRSSQWCCAWTAVGGGRRKPVCSGARVFYSGARRCDTEPIHESRHSPFLHVAGHEARDGVHRSHVVSIFAK
eukprot:11163462-Lingulodinium_polyedra.AAC.1